MTHRPFIAPRFAGALATLALGLFAAGLWVFGAQRQWPGLAGQAAALWPWLRAGLPSFVHTYAITLLGCLMLARGWRHALGIGAAAWALDLLLEVLQHRGLHGWLGTPTGLQALLASTFDPADMAAITLGALAAWATLALARLLEVRGGP